MPEPFLLGVNYWPRRKAMAWWSDFDPIEVADEFDLIADLGLGVVRIFLLWDDWQPNPDRVDGERLADLGRVCDLAVERGLRLDVTFFTGHMSGPNWVPGWLLEPNSGYPAPGVRQVVSRGAVTEGGYRNPIHDPVALAASRRLIREVVGVYRDHPAIWMWNLANEPDLFVRPESASAGRSWVAEMTAEIRWIDPVHPVTCGLHAASLVEDNGWRVDQVFAETDVAVMHGYPMYADWSRGPLDPDFVPFLCALTSALCGKPTLAEEWGGCTVPGESTTWNWSAYGQPRQQYMAGEEAFASYVAAVLDRLVAVGSPGAMLWCFADYSEELWDRPPCEDGGARHERHFGLVRPDGSLKPHAEVVRRFAAGRPESSTASRAVELGLTADEYYHDPASHARRLYAEFLRPQ